MADVTTSAEFLSSRFLGPGAAPSGGAAVYTGQVAVDFGANGDLVIAAVTGQAWVTAAAGICLTIQPNPLDHSTEDVLLEQMLATVGDYVVGDGFSIYVHAPNSTWGRYSIKWVGTV